MSKKTEKNIDEERVTSQLMNPQFSALRNFDLHEQIRSTIELCVPNIKSSKEPEDKMLVNMEKISNINLSNEANGEETSEPVIRGLYENVDHILDATNKMRLEKERERSVNIDVITNTSTGHIGKTCANEETDKNAEIKKKTDLTNSSTQEEAAKETKSVTNELKVKKEKEQAPPNVEYYLKSSMIELNDCIKKLCSGCCDFKQRNLLTQKITNIVPELNNLYNKKNICYIKDHPSVNEIAQIVPEWKTAFEKMNRRALEDTEDMIQILKRIKNMKNDLYILNKDLIEDREEFENIKFETVEHDAAVTLIENKNKKYIKGALKLDNMGQKIKRAFNIPVNPLTNFTISEHINRLLNYEEELLMGNDFLGKYSKNQHFEILRFKNSNKKFELFEKEDGEACYVIDMLISDLKKVHEEKKKEFERIDKKMKLCELTDLHKFKGFMDVTLNNHNVCINEFKESIKEAIIILFDIYEYFAKKNLKVKKIDESYIKNYVTKDMLPLNTTEINMKKEKNEEKYFMSLNFTRKKPIDHPFFIYHCLSPTFMFHFVNFILNPECLENQKNFMQHCSISGFNSVIFCQQILKLRKQEKEFTNNDYAYDFSSAYSKVLCADVCSVVLKSFNENNCVEEHVGGNKYLIALRNASDDFFQNSFKKRTDLCAYKSINKTVVTANTNFFSGESTTDLNNKINTSNILHGINANIGRTTNENDGTCGFQLLHFIPDELTSLSNKQTAICYDDSIANGALLESIKNYDLNKFNILKVSPQPILSNTSNELLYRKMKQQIPLFTEIYSGNGTNETLGKFMTSCMPTLSNMVKDNPLEPKGEMFGMQNRNIFGNNTSTNLFNNNMTNTNNANANYNTLSGGSNIFSTNINNTSSIFTEKNTGNVGNNTTQNMFSTNSNNLFGNSNTNSPLTNTYNSTNLFGHNSTRMFSNNNSTNNKLPIFGANTATFTNSTTNSLLNNTVTPTSSGTNIFANNTNNSLFGNTSNNNIFGAQNNNNSFLNKGNRLTENSTATMGFGNNTNTNVMNTSGMNTSSSIFGYTNNATATNTSNMNSIFNQNKTNIFGNNNTTGVTGSIFGNTSNTFLGNNANKSNINNEASNSNSFGIFGKSNNTTNNTLSLFGNKNSSNLFTDKKTNSTSNLFTSMLTTGTTNIFGNNSNSFNNATSVKDNTNTSTNAFGFSNNTNQFGGNNTGTCISGNLFGGNSNNSSSSIFGNTNNSNTTNSLFGLNKSSFNTENNSLFGKPPISNSSSLFGSTTQSLNNTGLANNKNAGNTGIFGNMHRQNNTPTNNFTSNYVFGTNTNNSLLSSKNSPFTSSFEQSKFTNNTNFFSTGNTNNTNANITGNSSLFGMNNNSLGVTTNVGTNASGSSSNIFGNKLSGDASNGNIFGKNRDNIPNTSFNNNSLFNTNQQTSSFLGKTNPANMLNNSFSSKMNNNTFPSNPFGSSTPFVTNTNMNSNANTFAKSNFFGSTSLPLDGNKNMNSTSNIFNNTHNESRSNLFGSNSNSNSTMGINSFGNNLNNTNIQRGGITSTDNNNIFGTGNRTFGSTNTFNCSPNTNTNINNENRNQACNSLFMSSALGQNNINNRNTTPGNAMDNRSTSNLFSKNNIASSNFMNNTNPGSAATTGLFQNQQSSFAPNNKTGTSIFGIGNSLTNNSSSNNLFQNNSFFGSRQAMSNTNTNTNTNANTNANTNTNAQGFNLQNTQNIFQQSTVPKPTTHGATGGFFS